MIFTVICSSSVLVYYHLLHLQTIPLLFAALLTLLVQSFTYFKVGHVEKVSKDWINTWKHCGFKYGLIYGFDRNRMNMYLKSCEPIYAKIGDFGGKIKKETGLKIMGKAIMYTMKTVITLRKGLIEH